MSASTTTLLNQTELDRLTGIPNVNESQGPVRVSHTTVINHNLMLHEQLFPAASRSTDYINSEVKLDRRTRFEMYERALVKVNKQSLDCTDSREISTWIVRNIKRTVPNRLLQKFLVNASEENLDNILILQTRLYNCALTVAGTLRAPNLLGALPHITSRVHTNAATTKQCKCQLNSRIVKATRTYHTMYKIIINNDLCSTFSA